jgi:hypothetical protein
MVHRQFQWVKNQYVLRFDVKFQSPDKLKFAPLSFADLIGESMPVTPGLTRGNKTLGIQGDHPP